MGFRTAVGRSSLFAVLIFYVMAVRMWQVPTQCRSSLFAVLIFYGILKDFILYSNVAVRSSLY